MFKPSMIPSRYLIVNADDLGFSPEVNRGIFAAYEKGVVTDASLLIKRPCTQEAIEMIKKNHPFPVGIHVDLDALLGWESPGREKYSRLALQRMLDNPSFARQIKKEIIEQIEAFLATGLIPSHLDTHHHVHGFPQIFKPLVEVMKRYQIKAIRFSKKGYSLMGREDILLAPETAQWMEDVIRKNGIAYPHYLIDPLFPFSLHELTAGVSELMVHPSAGGDAWRQKDLEMLMTPLFMKTVHEERIKLMSFATLTSFPFFH
jgi:predicted glycoside hydrolase/deacetylase ChbG (UPF0249 family)